MIKKGLTPRLAEVGKIKIGGKGEERKGKKGMYRLPVRYDHFVITTTERLPDKQGGNFVPDLELMEKIDPKENWKDGQTFGQPKEIPIIFLFDDIDMNFRTEYAYYQGAKCMCRGDGEIAERLYLKAGKQTVLSPDEKHTGSIQVKEGEKHKIICNTEKCPFAQADAKGVSRCKPSGVLSCLIPASMNIGGVYRFRTHSWNTISNILASLELIKTITGGLLVGLPMKLQFLKKATTDHGNVSVVNVVFDGESQQKMRELAFIENKNRIEFGVNMLQIEHNAKKAGFMANTDSDADIEAEFYTVPEEKKDPINITDRAELVLEGVQGEGFTVGPGSEHSIDNPPPGSKLLTPEKEEELEPTIEDEAELDVSREKDQKGPDYNNDGKQTTPRVENQKEVKSKEPVKPKDKQPPPDDGLEIF